MNGKQHLKPGPVALFGSGETAPSGQKIFHNLFSKLSLHPEVSLLETPAGFELNSAQVAGNVARFIKNHLQNFHPSTRIVPARKKGTRYSPDDPDLLQPLLTSDLIFLGPGSPTYAVRQLQDSLAWSYTQAAQLQGAALALASASTIAVSGFALPVYEIYKVGQDIHWQPGLDLFANFNLSLSFIPHWNNTEGGADLDTSRCFVGRDRFNLLLKRLPADHTIIGLDEHTGMLIDFQTRECRVIGLGNATLVSGSTEQKITAGNSFPLTDLGDYRLPDPGEILPATSWEAVQTARAQRNTSPLPPESVRSLAEKRRQARQNQDWDLADQLREEIARQGWEIQDTAEGFNLVPDSRS